MPSTLTSLAPGAPARGVPQDLRLGPGPAQLTSHSLAALSVNAVTDREVTRALVGLTKDGLADASVRAFRASLSSFFTWAVRERLILANPVLRTRVPRSGGPRAEMYPFSEDSTVQAWMGHASIATTNLYLHHLGTPADRAGLDRLNGRGSTGGTRSEVGHQ